MTKAEGNTNKLWGGRFKKSLDPRVEKFHASIGFDQRLYPQDILGSQAHAAMLGKQGIITVEESQQLIKGLAELKADIEAGKITFNLESEDIHMNIETLLISRIGDVAKKLHTARSRNDQVALDLRLFMRQTIDHSLAQLHTIIATFTNLSQQHVNTIMPGYTHLQHAQPITLALHLEAYIAMFTRDIDRLNDCRRRLNKSPLGAGALAGTSLPIDRNYVAQQLGFDDIIENPLDAVSDRDFVIEFTATASLIMMHLSRLSEEIIVWSTQEFRFVEIDDAFATGSSLMPNKKNPDVPELIRGKTGRVYGQLMSLLTMMKALPLAYNKDMQEDKEAVFNVIDTLDACLDVIVPFLQSLEFLTENMQKSVTNSYMHATRIVDDLVKLGIAFREAHEIVGNLVGYCIENRKYFHQLQKSEWSALLPVNYEYVDFLKLY